MSGGRATFPPGSEHARAWSLDPAVVFLNHGSFGACPRAVIAAQRDLQSRMEAEPVRFFIRELPDLLDRARRALAAFIGGDSDGLVFVANATTGVNTALQAVPLVADDEILVTDHGYPACRNAVEARARSTGARLIEAAVPFPLASSSAITERVLDAVSPRTRLAVIDHVTSPTGLIYPVDELVPELERRGIAVIVDGAHAPGMLELDLRTLGAPLYTGNCHKWLCAPKGAGFLWLRDDWRTRVHPLVTSHGAAAIEPRNRLHAEFDWTGTADPSPWLAVPAAIDAVAALTPGGWPEVRSRNHALAVEARAVLCEALAVDPPSPDELIGALAAVPLPTAMDPGPTTANRVGPLQEQMYTDHSIEVPVTTWADGTPRALRISAHLYNDIGQYRYLASALRSVLSVLPVPRPRD